MLKINGEFKKRRYHTKKQKSSFVAKYLVEVLSIFNNKFNENSLINQAKYFVAVKVPFQIYVNYFA